MTWRFIAQRISGPAAGEFLHWNLPVKDAEITDALGPAWFSGTLAPDLLTLKGDDGHPLLEKWSTALWAEEDGIIRGGGILANSAWQGPRWKFDCTGYAGYPTGIIYVSEASWAGIDPLNVVRHLWNHVQAEPGGNLGMVVDDTTTPMLVGNAEEPYTLQWWKNQDCGDEIEDLSKETPFDYKEEHAWVGTTNAISHRLRLGYPRIGSRRHDLRFVLGENMAFPPTVEDEGDEFANEVLGLGAGNGRDMLQTRLTEPSDTRLRRMRVSVQKGEDNHMRLVARTRDELHRALGTIGVGEIEVRDHPNAPIGSWQAGDEIRVQARRMGWVDFDGWCRIISSTIQPEKAGYAVLSLEKAE